MHRSLVHGILALFFPFTIAHAATLEVPSEGAKLSGIGFISGWKCETGEITVTLNDEEPIPLATNQPRLDTGSVCGDVDNGFITQTNWNQFGDGEHTIIAYDDGEEFDRVTFTVTTPGETFLRGARAAVSIEDFPTAGEIAFFAWQESTQHLELVAIIGAPDPPAPPAPEEITEGFTQSLHQAVKAGNAAAVESLIAQGADVHALVPPFDWNALHYAALTSTPQVVRLLLAAGALVEAQTSGGNRPLYFAVQNSNHAAAVTRLLLEAGADAHALNEFEYTALDRAGSVEVVVLLLAEGMDVNRRAPDSTPLHGAVLGGNLAVIRLLLAVGADVHAQVDWIGTPLHLAASPGSAGERAEMVRLLLDAGADVHARGRNGHTPLHEAVNGRSIEVLRLLLDAGADVDAENHDGDTPLELAEKDEQAPPEMVELLRQGG